MQGPDAGLCGEDTALQLASGRISVEWRASIPGLLCLGGPSLDQDDGYTVSFRCLKQGIVRACKGPELSDFQTFVFALLKQGGKGSVRIGIKNGVFLYLSSNKHEVRGSAMSADTLLYKRCRHSTSTRYDGSSRQAHSLTTWCNGCRFRPEPFTCPPERRIADFSSGEICSFRS